MCLHTSNFWWRLSRNINAADVDECRSYMMPCDENAGCINLGGSFSCTCNPGYIGNGKTCAPFSKPIKTDAFCFYYCFTDDDSCPEVCDQYCIRSSEPFLRICACDHGYYLDADNHTCRGACTITFILC